MSRTPGTDQPGRRTTSCTRGWRGRCLGRCRPPASPRRCCPAARSRRRTWCTGPTRSRPRSPRPKSTARSSPRCRAPQGPRCHTAASSDWCLGTATSTLRSCWCRCLQTQSASRSPASWRRLRSSRTAHWLAQRSWSRRSRRTAGAPRTGPPRRRPSPADTTCIQACPRPSSPRRTSQARPSRPPRCSSRSSPSSQTRQTRSTRRSPPAGARRRRSSSSPDTPGCTRPHRDCQSDSTFRRSRRKCTTRLPKVPH
mmetsp:Transcript_77262/g.167075  ORF Transcript_77262/g.167075 Transcript_77262/m.167075 type:complete len:254 (+) Transcript_77262:2919-3680(+)